MGFFALQPNGRYCHFDYEMDKVDKWNMTREEVIAYFEECARIEAERVLERAHGNFSRIKADFRPREESPEEFDKKLKSMGDSGLTEEEKQYYDNYYEN